MGKTGSASIGELLNYTRVAGLAVRLERLPYDDAMPELPEVETVRRGLEAAVLGRVVRRVTVRRGDVITGPHTPRDLLRGLSIGRVDRHGKQLAIVGGDGPVVCVHLGMTGSLVVRDETADAGPHTHVLWHLTGGKRLEFRDPRRFGGVWTFPSVGSLQAERWSLLGEDALTIPPGRLLAGLLRTTRGVKAALLDQAIVAGLGNIYADELLFRAGVHPLTPANQLDHAAARTLVRAMRKLLQEAIAAGGTTLRDYVNGRGEPGWFQFRHRVYGRGGQACVKCGTALLAQTIAQRTTTWCPACQKQVSAKASNME